MAKRGTRIARRRRRPISVMYSLLMPDCPIANFFLEQVTRLPGPRSPAERAWVGHSLESLGFSKCWDCTPLRDWPGSHDSHGTTRRYSPRPSLTFNFKLYKPK